MRTHRWPYGPCSSCSVMDSFFSDLCTHSCTVLSLSLSLSSLITRLRRKAKELRTEWRMRRQRALFHRSFNANHRKTLASLPSLSSRRSEKPFLFSLSLDGRLGKDTGRPAPCANTYDLFSPKHDEMHRSTIPFFLPALS